VNILTDTCVTTVRTSEVICGKKQKSRGFACLERQRENEFWSV